MDEVDVRPATSADLGHSCRELFLDVSKEQLANRFQELADGHRNMLVATCNDTVVGTVSYQSSDWQSHRSVRLFALDVAKPYRRKGIGLRLVAAVQHEARRRGATEITLEVSIANRAAICLYERAGFSQMGEPFINVWQKRTAEGSETVEEKSIRMAQTVPT